MPDKLNTKIKPWDVLGTEEPFTVPPWVRVYRDKIRLPSGRVVDNYYRIHLPEFVMVYAKRDDGKILIERQYKHALGAVALALPTGCFEDGEMPVEAGKRELLEETGYIAERWMSLGAFLVDGNKGCGRAHFFIADGIKKIREPIADDMEESEIVFIEPELFMKAVLNSEVPLLTTAALVAIATHPYLSCENK